MAWISNCCLPTVLFSMLRYEIGGTINKLELDSAGFTA